MALPSPPGLSFKGTLSVVGIVIVVLIIAGLVKSPLRALTSPAAAPEATPGG